MDSKASTTLITGNQLITTLFAGALAYTSYVVLRYFYTSSCQNNKKMDCKGCCNMKSNKVDCIGCNNEVACCGSKQQNSKEQVVVELGGTSVRIALIKKEFTNGVVSKIQVLKQSNIPTEGPKETIQNLFKDYKQYDLNEIGVASFGPICLNKNEKEYGSITSTPKLLWQNFPVTKYISEITDAKNVYIETDVNSAAWAEFILGNHGVNESLAYITIGTGVGVGLIIGGKTVHGLTHPEGGHILLHEDEDFKGVCPFHDDCVEGFITNHSIATRLGISIHDLPSIKNDNPIWARVGHYIAELCLNITLIASPEVIVIGGGVMNQPNLLKFIQKDFQKLLNNYVQHPKLKNIENYIKKPTLPDSGLYGAALLNEGKHTWQMCLLCSGKKSEDMNELMNRLRKQGIKLIKLLIIFKNGNDITSYI